MTSAGTYQQLLQQHFRANSGTW